VNICDKTKITITTTKIKTLQQLLMEEHSNERMDGCNTNMLSLQLLLQNINQLFYGSEQKKEKKNNFHTFGTKHSGNN
jgi:hypothetical protein